MIVKMVVVMVGVDLRTWRMKRQQWWWFQGGGELRGSVGDKFNEKEDEVALAQEEEVGSEFEVEN